MPLSTRLLHLLFFICVGLPWLLTTPGCGGCRQDPLARKKTEDEKRKEEELGQKKEKPKPDFEPFKVTVLPGTIPLVEDEETIDGTVEESPDSPLPGRLSAKPGHWVHARYLLKANNADFQGELMAQCVDRKLDAMELEKSPFWVTSTRPAVLPQGQSKEIEIPVFVAVPTQRDRTTVQVLAHLRTRGGGRNVMQDAVPTTRLKPHQYHLVVLAREPNRYGYLRALPAIKPPFDDWTMEGLQEDYIVTLHGSQEGQLLPLPANPLAWTSIAFMTLG